MNRKYIITGAPGTGKTSIIKKLREKHFNCIDEQSRELITHQIKNGGDALPWKNQIAFENTISNIRTQQYLSVNKNSICFFDRSTIDCIAYLKLNTFEISLQIEKNIKKCIFNNTVFYTPFWEEIYINDKERKENIEQAKKIEIEIIKAYQSLDYNLIKIPKISIKKRVDFIISKI